MKKLILIIFVVISNISIAAVSDGSSGITAVSDGSSGITAVSDGSSGITAVSDGSSGITAVSDGSSGVSSIGNVQFMQLGNGFIRSCFQTHDNTTACSIIRP